ncbi:hypothetical protein Tcan_15286 [Toxocara canis]|uniref:ISXO2-like transposase domain-containing protein n=1 Tax=Toxocara canis TaxID=6265 RepID=A0A0B2VNA0_TOXCA|nr:hypothetical protein Tcan_15286 [Toxocara canis]
MSVPFTTYGANQKMFDTSGGLTGLQEESDASSKLELKECADCEDGSDTVAVVERDVSHQRAVSGGRIEMVVEETNGYMCMRQRNEELHRLPAANGHFSIPDSSNNRLLTTIATDVVGDQFTNYATAFELARQQLLGILQDECVERLPEKVKREFCESFGELSSVLHSYVEPAQKFRFRHVGDKFACTSAASSITLNGTPTVLSCTVEFDDRSRRTATCEGGLSDTPLLIMTREAEIVDRLRRNNSVESQQIRTASANASMCSLLASSICISSVQPSTSDISESTAQQAFYGKINNKYKSIVKVVNEEIKTANRKRSLQPSEKMSNFLTAWDPMKSSPTNTCLDTLTATEKVAFQFKQEAGLIRSSAPLCDFDGCGRQMHLMRRKHSFIWRCAKHSAQEYRVNNGSLFENSKLSHVQHVQLLFLWAHRTPLLMGADLVQITERALQLWFARFRHVCSRYLQTNPHPIGGRGMVVQLDSFRYAGRNIGRRWIFGGYCPQMKRGFLEVLLDRSAGTLLAIIQRYVTSGSTIHTDMSPAYIELKNSGGLSSYEHLMVNDSSNFVDPINGACKNYVECYWNKCEDRFKVVAGNQSAQLAAHLNEFRWREIRGRSGEEAFQNIIIDIRSQYPLP